MKKEEVPAVSGDAPVAPPEMKQTLQEFCSRLSLTVNRPELIGAFDYVQRTKGVLLATEAEFKQAFDEFVKKPV